MTSHPPHPKPRILFVDGLWVEKFGIMSLIPHLQKAGWEVDYRLTRNPRRFLNFVAAFNPHVLAFSATTGYHTKALQFAALAKEHFPQIKTIMGGPHVTYFPEVAHEPSLDAAFRGECDPFFPQSLAQWLDNDPPEEIFNLVNSSADGSLVQGPLAPLPQDLDALPLPDRKLLYRHRFFKNAPFKAFMVSRGCPYNCAFCFNHKLKEMYRGKGTFVRMRSPESIAKEGKDVLQKYGMKLASFEDDLLTGNKQWLEAFATRWKREVGVPYNLNATARDLADPEIVKILKETGVWCVAFGIETGNEQRRKTLLNKPLSNDLIRQAGYNLNRFGVRFMTYNMFALPNESLDEARETLRLNREIGTKLARYTLFEPYPGTQLGDQIAHIHETEVHFNRKETTETTKKRVERIQKYAMLGMRWKLGEKIAVQASRLPLEPLHDLVFWSTYFNVVRRYMKTGVKHLAELGFRSLTNRI